MSIDIVIPVHNATEWLAYCLEELNKHKTKEVRSITVVDDNSNHSQKLNIFKILDKYKNIKLVKNNSSHKGFGGSCNLGASKGISSKILFLNTDCLITEFTISKLAESIDQDKDTVLACPVSNNSPNYSYPMLMGRSYVQMAQLISLVTEQMEKKTPEASTVVGNCLMVSREFFELVNGFDPIWGLGYGEETDLQMKAISNNKKGVVHLGSYVYHFGGGSFSYVDSKNLLAEKNYFLFLKKWGNDYRALISRSSHLNHLNQVSRALNEYLTPDYKLELDVLFVLPGIDQNIGGMHAVIDICNFLIRNEMKAGIALIGITSEEGAKRYREPVLFNFLYYATADDFLGDKFVIPKIVFSTIFSSAEYVAKFCKKRRSKAIQFIQGYEGYFENGKRYLDAVDSYKKTSEVIVTSDWLYKMVSPHLNPKQKIKKLPLIINQNIFFVGSEKRNIDIVLIFREGPDKGQWLLAEIARKLSLLNDKVCIIYSPTYAWIEKFFGSNKNFNLIKLPLSRSEISDIFRRTKVYLDLSLHEGYGLLPLEATLCGCKVIANNSGGINEYSKHFKTIQIDLNPDTESAVKIIQKELQGFKGPANREMFKLQNPEMWISYINRELKNIQPIPFQERVKITGTFYNKKYPFLIILLILKNVAIKLYKQMAPYIPKRIRLGIKVIISGHV